MTDTLDLAALKRTARAAWDAYDAPIESDGWTYLRHMEAFRNAHTPAAALALIARVEALEVALRDTESLLRGANGCSLVDEAFAVAQAALASPISQD